MAIPLITATALAPIIATAGKFLVGYIIVRIIAIFGIALVTYGAVDQIAGQIQDYIVNSVTGIGGEFLVMANALGVIDSINIISSAYIASISVRALMGAYSRITFGKK